MCWEREEQPTGRQCLGPKHADLPAGFPEFCPAGFRRDAPEIADAH